MQVSIAKFFLLISLLFLSCLALPVVAQKCKYAAMIETDKGYVSGICFLSEEGDTVKGSIFNEFGISVLDFTYLRSRQKVRLENVIKMLDKWYTKRVLRKDLVQVLENLQRGLSSYRNEKYHILYQFTRLYEKRSEGLGERRNRNMEEQKK